MTLIIIGDALGFITCVTLIFFAGRRISNKTKYKQLILAWDAVFIFLVYLITIYMLFLFT